MIDIGEAITALFVPGDRPDRYATAVASGADLVIIDLEDGVAADHKITARAAAAAALAGDLRALVRVAHADDLDAIAGLPGLVGIVVPKAADPVRLNVIATIAPVVALIESAAGVARARELAAVHGVVRLAFGALDFALDVGADPDAITGQVARAQVVIAGRAAGLPGPLESPAVGWTDPADVEHTTRAAASLGFTGRLCIHPAQLAPVRAAFAPTAAEVAWAERIATAGEGAVRVDDQMVDRPVRERARAILRRAGKRDLDRG